MLLVVEFLGDGILNVAVAMHTLVYHTFVCKHQCVCVCVLLCVLHACVCVCACMHVCVCVCVHMCKTEY